MLSANVVAAANDKETPRRNLKDSTFYVVLKQFAQNKTAIIGLTILILLIIMSIFASSIAPYNPEKIDPINANATPSIEHWFGTDGQGRDIFSRILFGARYSLSIGIVSSVVGTVAAVFLGLLAGYMGGWSEALILRFCDVIESIPNLLLCIIISAVLGTGYIPTVIALAVSTVPGLTRLLRATILNIREQEYIEAARAIDCKNMRIMLRHVLPNSVAPVIVHFSTGVGGKIMSSASLSFLGLGIQEPAAEWGAMMAAGRAYLRYYPHLIIFPGICIALVVLSFNMVGDALRDALDPKLRA